jgi:flagellar motor protein MotB
MANEPIDPINETPVPSRATSNSSSPAQQANAWRNNNGRLNNGGYGNADLSNIEMPSHWAVPWSDLMMVMMVMFAVMLATNLAERDVSELFKKDAITQSKQPVKPPPPLATATQEQPRADIKSEQKIDTEIKPTEKNTAESTAPNSALGSEPTRLEKSEKGAIPIQDILRLSKNLVTEANLEDIDVVLTDNQSIKVSVRGNLLFDLGKADLKPEAISFLQHLAQIIATNNYQIEVVGHTDNFPVSNPAYPTNWELSSARAARVARYLIQYGKLEPGRFTVIGHSYYQPIVANDSLMNKAKNRRVEIIITRYEYHPEQEKL